MKSILIGTCLLLSSIVAVAQADEAPTAGKAGKVTYKKHTTMDFEEKAVDGEFRRPDGAAVEAEQGLAFDSLMEPRNNFKKELKRSSGAVR